MGRKDWKYDSSRWYFDPTADKNCPICKGRGVLVVYSPADVEVECFNCIKDCSKEAILAAVQFEQPAPHKIIAMYAKKLWEEAGEPIGRDEEFWLQAEQELNLRSGI